MVGAIASLGCRQRNCIAKFNGLSSIAAGDRLAAMPLKPDCVASMGHAKSMMKLD